MKCKNCGNDLKEGDKYCNYCGEPTEVDESGNLNETSSIKHAAPLKLKDLFFNVFKRHKRSELEDAFVAGTHYNTLSLSEVSDKWPKPWVYSRVFLVFLLTFAVLSICTLFFYNLYSITGMMFIGAMVIPFSLVIFFFESNAPRNISIITVIQVFFVGGVMSLLAALILYTVFSANDSVLGAFVIGFVEEAAKIIVVYAVIKKLNCKYILNGILIGAAVGAGFAVFETAGYALDALIYNGNSLSFDVYNMLAILWIRSLLSIGGHTSYAAISGGALVWAREKHKMSFGIVTQKRFVWLFLFVVIIHAVWDFPIWNTFIPYVVLCVICIIVTLRMMHLGLKQITRLQREEEDALLKDKPTTDSEPPYKKDDIFLG